MITRRFGRTGIQMPVFSCGGMRYQYKWQDRPLSEVPQDNQKNLEQTIFRAFEVGINHIETARGYGSSERQLGPVIAKLPRAELILQTKVAPTEDPKEFEAHFHESLARLQVEYVDLFALHGLNTEQKLAWSLRPGGCFDVAQKLRREGKCRYIGFSSHGSLGVIQKAIAHGEAGVGQSFDYVNLHWYFIFQRNWAAVEAAAKRDMGVFIISPSDKGGKLYDPPASLRRLCEPLSPMVFNDLFCLSHPQVATLSIGAAKPSDFEEHLKVLPLLTSASTHVRPVVERLRDAMRKAVGNVDPEWATQALPEWQQLPGQLNLQTILWLRNIALGWGLLDYAKGRYNLLNAADDWFPGARPDSEHVVDEEAIRSVLGDSVDRSRILREFQEAVTLLSGETQQRLSQGG